VKADRPDPATLGKAGHAIWLRRDAEKIAGSLPPLLAEAEQLAKAVSSGFHGRRRTGPGENFWQFRRALPGDSAASIDWRRSGRTDELFIREREWEAAQTVSIWADNARSMEYAGPDAERSKADRARLLALSLAILLSQAGERSALAGTRLHRARTGETHLQRMAMELAGAETEAEYGAVPDHALQPGSHAVYLSDFLGPTESVESALLRATDHGVGGCLVQILDDSEENFPFDGRVIFESMAGSLDFETHRARALRPAYQQKLQERRDYLTDLCQRTGWRFLAHRTGESPRKALLWLYAGIGGAT
jgi:uncharacterized protein (DUF58 family)